MYILYIIYILYTLYIICIIHEIVYICIYLYICGSPLYPAKAQYHWLTAIGRDSGLSIMCHSWRFVCLQRVLKPFPGSGHFSSEDGVA